MPAEPRPLPLAGIRVVDFSWVVAGPQATRILADLGAQVIKVENEAHVDSQRVGPELTDPPNHNLNAAFNNFNRNKLGITVNLHHPGGREVVEKLIALSDVVVENFSPGAFERMGFSWERLQQINPTIIYESLSGFGHLGRDTSYVTWGPTAQAVSGVTAMSGLPGHPPAGWGFSYLDHTAGYYGAIAILMALHHRKRTGEAQYIDVSQVETGMVLCGVPMLDYQVNGREYAMQGNHSRWPAVAPHSVYRCKDSLHGEDRWIAVVAESEEQWQALCAVFWAFPWSWLSSIGRPSCCLVGLGERISRNRKLYYESCAFVRARSFCLCSSNSAS
jgi:crotonobetainyl-CoA:carnitine CoA-transferase CaiB-like acyl-CoA transferase